MKKKPVKKSGPSTGGSVNSRVRDEDSKNKKVPVTSVTGKITTPKPSAKRVAGTRKAVAGAAMAATGVSGAARAAAKTAAKAASRAEVKSAVSGIQKIAKDIMDANVRLNKRPNPKGAYAQAAREWEKKQLTKKVVPPKPKGR